MVEGLSGTKPNKWIPSHLIEATRGDTVPVATVSYIHWQRNMCTDCSALTGALLSL